MSTYKVFVPAGPIWNNDPDAKKKGPIVAAAHMAKWTGEWTTVISGEMSVVELEYTYPPTGTDEFTTWVPAGPIWNNDDAQEKGPVVCASYGGEWTGQWKTVVESKMSLCECKYKI